ncbi:Npun_F5749 family FMN-dependent PPOX-type flavoprotein [Myxosarcina sp. GI1]|uniref:Npun_F5749 family FMN-dependent PPOX-type flavoprotein n=1 Tax=Myxosarcina sp. GI1 TaxID=1541065 RepID=UPI00055F8390|nr:Npun_F5749 family FMN-dependent PPOX-type flavoprotein [Myxosarcina sp. GI1]
MSLTPWRSLLARALHRNRSQPHCRYLQLATITPEGYPANRTVVFRGFLDNTNDLKIVVDSRSKKIRDIQHLPHSEGCWYFTKTREQFRLTGSLNLVTAESTDKELQTARQTTWHNLSEAARSQFSWPHPEKQRADKEAFTVDVPDENIPLNNFCLLLLIPTKVDHLELRGEPQSRTLYYLHDGSWSIRAVNP